MTEKDFLPSPYKKTVQSGSVSWKAPSNIALVKYWGKKEHQLPANPSISFTLDFCATTTTLRYQKLPQEMPIGQFRFDLFFEGKEKPDFKPKIQKFFERVENYVPFLKDYHFTIETSNSFPHSSGIASSASGMAALALCLVSLEKELVDKDVILSTTSTLGTGSVKGDVTLSAVEGSFKDYESYFLKKASFLARLGSGSASRSTEGPLVVWGEHRGIEGSTNLFGIKYPYEMHPVFNNYQDTILLVDKGEKQVSSTAGHNLMHNHPFAEKRFAQAHENLSELQKIVAEGDLEGFVEVVESEALTLHAMMMTGSPYFMLMKPNTLEIINKIWKYRKQTGSHACFTLDAGANVHLLYPEHEQEAVLQFINNELVAHCQNGQYICDRIGMGAAKLKMKNEE